MPSRPGWLNINTDGADFGSLGIAGYAGVFRICRGFVKGCFTIPLGVCFAFSLLLSTRFSMSSFLVGCGCGWRAT